MTKWFVNADRLWRGNSPDFGESAALADKQRETLTSDNEAIEVVKLKEVQQLQARVQELEAEKENYRATLSDIVEIAKDSMLPCERCGHEESIENLDIVYLARAALSEGEEK